MLSRITLPSRSLHAAARSCSLFRPLHPSPPHRLTQGPQAAATQLSRCCTQPSRRCMQPSHSRPTARVCGVKNALRTSEDRESWRKMGGGFRENTHHDELEKNAKMLEKINTIINLLTPRCRLFRPTAPTT